MARRFTKQAVTQEDHNRITHAIRTAERRTSGEVFAVIAHTSDDYFYVSGFMSLAWSLAVCLLLAVLMWLAGWNVSALVLGAALFLSNAVSLTVLYFFPHLRLLLVPRSVAFKRASAEAVRQFLAHGVHTTANRTGILLYVSLAEHYAEVIADAAINSKVDQSQWDVMVSDMVEAAKKDQVADGFISAIGRAQALLTQYFPPIEGQLNELDDRLVEL